MGVEIRWRSEQGHRTDDNRDCCGVGLRDDAVLAVVLDGSSNGKASGASARDVARNLIDWFVVAEVVTPKTIIDRLRVIHAELSRTYRRDSASVVIALIERQCHCTLINQILRIRRLFGVFCTLNYNVSTGIRVSS